MRFNAGSRARRRTRAEEGAALAATTTAPGGAVVSSPHSVRQVGEELHRAVGVLSDRMGCTRLQAYAALSTVAMAVVAGSLALPSAFREQPPVDPTLAAAPSETAPPTTSGSPPMSFTAVGPGSTGSPRFDAVAPLFDIDIAIPLPFDDPPNHPEPVTTFASMAPPGAPSGIAVADDGSVFVSTDNANGPSAVVHLAPNGAPVARFEVTGQPEDRTAGVRGIAVSDDAVVVADASLARVVRIARADGAQSTIATIPDVPPCGPLTTFATPACEPGEHDNAPLLHGLAVAADGRAYVADTAQHMVWRVEAGAVPVALHTAPGYVAGPTGLALDASGNPLFTATSSQGTATVFRLVLTHEGLVERRQKVVDLDAGSSPSGLALGGGDRLAVVASGSGIVVVFDSGGSEEARLPAPPGPNLSGPVGVAFVDGALLITTQAGRWGSVVRLPLD